MHIIQVADTNQVKVKGKTSMTLFFGLPESSAFCPFRIKTLMRRFSQKFYLLSTTVELKGFEPFFLLGCNSFKGSSYHAI